MNNEGSDDLSIDEQDCQVLLERALFGNPGEDEDLLDSQEQDDGISEHVWTCPTIGEDPRDEVSIIYHLAFLAPGHGDSLWNSSRCIAEHILNPKRRADLLGTLQPENEREDGVFNWPPKMCLEFGAGAALPSLALLKEGAQRVVFTDRYVNEQTFDALKLSVEKNALAWNIDDDEIRRRAFITNHTWGEEIEALSQTVAAEICNDAHVDLLIASDCIYNPTYHGALLQSASALINPSTGLLIVGYSLHGNVPTSHVESFFTEAKERYGLEILRELKVEYSEGQIGIGSEDESRGNVYLKMLACRDSIHFNNNI